MLLEYKKLYSFKFGCFLFITNQGKKDFVDGEVRTFDLKNVLLVILPPGQTYEYSNLDVKGSWDNRKQWHYFGKPRFPWHKHPFLLLNSTYNPNHPSFVGKNTQIFITRERSHDNKNGHNRWLPFGFFRTGKRKSAVITVNTMIDVILFHFQKPSFIHTFFKLKARKTHHST